MFGIKGAHCTLCTHIGYLVHNFFKPLLYKEQDIKWPGASFSGAVYPTKCMALSLIRRHCLKKKTYTHFCIKYVRIIQFVLASENQVGPVDFNRLLARGPVGKYPNVAACMHIIIIWNCLI